MFDYRIEDLINLEIEINGRRIFETINNKSENFINISKPRLEFFDGELWRIVPFNNDVFHTLEGPAQIKPNSSQEITFRIVNLDNYPLPRGGLFRIVRNISISGSDISHDLFSEFHL